MSFHQSQLSSYKGARLRTNASATNSYDSNSPPTLKQSAPNFLTIAARQQYSYRTIKPLLDRLSKRLRDVLPFQVEFLPIARVKSDSSMLLDHHFGFEVGIDRSYHINCRNCYADDKGTIFGTLVYSPDLISKIFEIFGEDLEIVNRLQLAKFNVNSNPDVRVVQDACSGLVFNFHIRLSNLAIWSDKSRRDFTRGSVLYSLQEGVTLSDLLDNQNRIKGPDTFALHSRPQLLRVEDPGVRKQLAANGWFVDGKGYFGDSSCRDERLEQERVAAAATGDYSTEPMDHSHLAPHAGHALNSSLYETINYGGVGRHLEPAKKVARFTHDDENAKIDLGQAPLAVAEQFTLYARPAPRAQILAALLGGNIWDDSQKAEFVAHVMWKWLSELKLLYQRMNSSEKGFLQIIGIPSLSDQQKKTEFEMMKNVCLTDLTRQFMTLFSAPMYDLIEFITTPSKMKGQVAWPAYIYEFMSSGYYYKVIENIDQDIMEVDNLMQSDLTLRGMLDHTEYTFVRRPGLLDTEDLTVLPVKVDVYAADDDDWNSVEHDTEQVDQGATTTENKALKPRRLYSDMVGDQSYNFVAHHSDHKLDPKQFVQLSLGNRILTSHDFVNVGSLDARYLAAALSKDFPMFTVNSYEATLTPFMGKYPELFEPKFVSENINWFSLFLGKYWDDYNKGTLAFPLTKIQGTPSPMS